jgi:hypothetical protein
VVSRSFYRCPVCRHAWVPISGNIHTLNWVGRWTTDPCSPAVLRERHSYSQWKEHAVRHSFTPCCTSDGLPHLPYNMPSAFFITVRYKVVAIHATCSPAVLRERHLFPVEKGKEKCNPTSFTPCCTSDGATSSTLQLAFCLLFITVLYKVGAIPRQQNVRPLSRPYHHSMTSGKNLEMRFW